jgi:transcriptional regulator GlxA family with amidase domain
MKNLWLLVGISLLACEPQPSAPVSDEIAPVAEGQHFNAAFLLIDGVYNSELMAPYDIFQHTIFHTQGGITVFTVAPDSTPVRTFEGLHILPHYTFDSPDLPEIDILVVASAEHNMDTDLENERLISWVKNTGQNADYVMSLCDGAFVLAKAGLVEGKESTTFPSDIPKYREMFPELTIHENVSFVHDGKLLTSNGGAKSYDVALYLVHHLYGEKVAKGVGKGLVIDWQLTDYQFIRKE